MALPLKSGADLYTQEIRRVALQNEGSDLTEYIIGSIYFNTNSANSNSSNRIRYRGLDTWHSVANYEDIEHLQNQIDNIDFASSEEFTSLKERVDAFLDGGVDSDDVLNNLKEIQAFLDAYDGATSLVDLLNAKADKEEFDSAIASITANFANYRLLTNGVFDVLINANQGIETNEITIGGIKLSVVDGHLCIDGDAYTTGQLASGGVAEDGGTSGGSGIVILEDWALLDDTQPQVVGAALGKDMYDRLGVAEANIEELIGRATNVRFSQTLTSGKEIGIIYVDEDPTTLYAPATYSWSDITDKPSDIVDVSSIRSIAESALAKNSFDVLHAASINSDVVSTERLYADSLNGFTPMTTGNHRAILDYVYAPYNAAGYLPLTGGTITGLLTLKPHNYHAIDIVSPDNSLAQITISTNDTMRGFLQYNSTYGFGFHYLGCGGLYVASNGVPEYVDSSNAKYSLIHTGNIGDYAIGYTSNKVSIDTARHSIGYDNGSVGTTNLPFSGGYISADVGSYGMQLLGAYNGNGLLYRGINNNTFTDWKTIAFTDSDISGNLAGTYIGTLDNETNPYLWLQENGGTKYYVQSYNGLLHLGPGATSSLIINSSGNVTIGGEDKAVANCKLYVDGKIRFETRTLWGQSFDGTGNVDGAIYIAGLHFVGRIGNDVAINYTGDTLSTMNVYANETYFHYGKPSSFLRAMTINSSGNVTIGSSDLAIGTGAKLWVDGKVVSTLVKTQELRLGENGHEPNGWYYASIGYVYTDTTPRPLEPAIVFKTMHLTYAEGTEVERMRIAANGDVGIGTTSPAYKLDVFGTGRFTDAVTLGNTLSVAGVSTLSRVLIRGAADDGSTSLQVQGDIKMIAGSLLVNTPGTYQGGWARGMTFSHGSTELCYLGVYGWGSEISYMYFGNDYANPWLKINSTQSDFNVIANLNAGALIPTGQTLKIGEATISWDGANSVLKVDKDFASDGQVSSGGIAEAASVITGSGLEKMVFTLEAGQTEYECEHNLGTREVTVCIYEDGDDFQQILTDVYLDDTNTARIVFGSVTDIKHNVVIVG